MTATLLWQHGKEDKNGTKKTWKYFKRNKGPSEVIQNKNKQFCIL